MSLQGLLTALLLVFQLASPSLAAAYSRASQSRVAMPLPPPRSFMRDGMGSYPTGDPGSHLGLSNPQPVGGMPVRWFALLSTAGVATAYTMDRRTWQVVSDSSSSQVHHMADHVSKFGDLRYLGPALIASFAIGKATSLPGMSSASARIGFSVLTAGAACGVLKVATGRSRPNASPNEPDEFAPFGGAQSFPSGHTTVAFACASALCEETHSSWVPWVAYPAAAAVGWSRMVQDQHWLSDVVAGAALGTWVGREVDLRLQRRQKPGVAATPLVRLSARRARVGIALRF
jgi:membrane-associated phospholipid phosphatase